MAAKEAEKPLAQAVKPTKNESASGKLRLRASPLLSCNGMEEIKRAFGISVRYVDNTMASRIIGDVETKLESHFLSTLPHYKTKIRNSLNYRKSDPAVFERRERDVLTPLYEINFDNKTFYLGRFYKIYDKVSAMLYYYNGDELVAAMVYKSQSHARWRFYVGNCLGFKVEVEDAQNLNYKLQIAVDNVLSKSSVLDAWYLDLIDAYRNSHITGVQGWDKIHFASSHATIRQKTDSEFKDYDNKAMIKRFQEFLGSPGLSIKNIGGYTAEGDEQHSIEIYEFSNKSGAYIVEIAERYGRRYVHCIERAECIPQEIAFWINEPVITPPVCDYTVNRIAQLTDPIISYYNILIPSLDTKKINLKRFGQMDKSRKVLSILKRLEKEMKKLRGGTGLLREIRIESPNSGYNKCEISVSLYSSYQEPIKDGYSIHQVKRSSYPLCSYDDVYVRIKKRSRPALWVFIRGEHDETLYFRLPLELTYLTAEQLFDGNKEILEKLGFHKPKSLQIPSI